MLKSQLLWGWLFFLLFLYYDTTDESHILLFFCFGLFQALQPFLLALYSTEHNALVEIFLYKWIHAHDWR